MACGTIAYHCNYVPFWGGAEGACHRPRKRGRDAVGGSGDEATGLLQQAALARQAAGIVDLAGEGDAGAIELGVPK